MSVKVTRNIEFINFLRYTVFGCVISEEEIPDPISNSEVKLFSAEGSARETWCEKRSMHPLFLKTPACQGFFYFYESKFSSNCVFKFFSRYQG